MNAAALAPKAVSIDVKITVRNIPADSFDEAKREASMRTERIRPEGMHFGYYAAREADGTYTVELR